VTGHDCLPVFTIRLLYLDTTINTIRLAIGSDYFYFVKKSFYE